MHLDAAVANGHEKSASKLSLNDNLPLSKIVDDEDEDDSSSDEDSFMFGMSKLRTFFFFLSLSLLVAFVLVFVFVLPCSESAQMNERTTEITDKGSFNTKYWLSFLIQFLFHLATPGVSSVTGDMDGDGKDDLAFVQAKDDSSSRSRREAEGNTSSKCIGQLHNLHLI